MIPLRACNVFGFANIIVQRFSPPNPPKLQQSGACTRILCILTTPSNLISPPSSLRRPKRPNQLNIFQDAGCSAPCGRLSPRPPTRQCHLSPNPVKGVARRRIQYDGKTTTSEGSRVVGVSTVEGHGRSPNFMFHRFLCIQAPAQKREEEKREGKEKKEEEKGRREG